MAAQDKAALEGEEEVLADRLDMLEAATVDSLGDSQRRRTRMGRLGGDDLALENAELLGRAVERVSLRHDPPRARRPGRGEAR